MDTTRIKFGADGLVPVVIQDIRNGKVLMMAWANEEALVETVRTQTTHFWSRSRKKLWNKGEESGNFQDVKQILVDCDGDCVLVLVEPRGPSCHTGTETCFFTDGDGEHASAVPFKRSVMDRVFETIKDRKTNLKPKSYVSALFEGGIDRIARKITEEAGETVIAAKNNNPDEIVSEMADLWFHCAVLLAEQGLSPSDVEAELEKRLGVSGYGKVKDKP